MKTQTQTYKPVTSEQIDKIDNLFVKLGWDMNKSNHRFGREYFIRDLSRLRI